MTLHEQHQLLTTWMRGRMEQGSSRLEAHRDALHLLDLRAGRHTAASRFACCQALEHLIADHQTAIERQEPYPVTHETIIMTLREVQQGLVPVGEAAKTLTETAARVSAEPEKFALYQAAVADLAQLAESDKTT